MEEQNNVMNKKFENDCDKVREILRTALNTNEEDVVKMASDLVERFKSLQRVLSPVTDNPEEDAFYEKAEASIGRTCQAKTP